MAVELMTWAAPKVLLADPLKEKVLLGAAAAAAPNEKPPELSPPMVGEAELPTGGAGACAMR